MSGHNLQITVTSMTEVEGITLDSDVVAVLFPVGTPGDAVAGVIKWLDDSILLSIQAKLNTILTDDYVEAHVSHTS